MTTPLLPAELEEALDRVRAMSVDEGQTWDLSPNDQAALKALLATIAERNATIVALRELADGARWLLEHIYPADVFTGESDDPGAIAVVKMRAALAKLGGTHTTTEADGE